MIAVLTIFIFLCVLIIPLRGPSAPKNSITNKTITPPELSNYFVNEDGWLEMMTEDKSADFFADSSEV